MTSAAPPRRLLLAFTVLAACGTRVGAQLERRPSPDAEFVSQPCNTTVPEGEQVVLKCMVANPVHVCRWYFVQPGLDFFSDQVSPMLIKDFKPSHGRDCSIRIKKVRKIQEGQWLCQALKFSSTRFLVSRPAVLRVLTKTEGVTWLPPTQPATPTLRQGRRQEEMDVRGDDVQFDFSHEDYIINTKLSESAVLKCQVNKPITSCAWSKPDGSVFNMSKDAGASGQSVGREERYQLVGQLSEGSCSLKVVEVELRDEGDWRCLVQVGDLSGHTAPPVHLHLVDHTKPSSHNHEGTPLVAREESGVSVLVLALVFVSTLLLVMVALLFGCFYRRSKQSGDETRRILQLSPQSSLNFSRKTLPTTDFTSASVFVADSVRKLPLKPGVGLDQYNQYLDMKGCDSTADGYVMMPGSSLRSSASSRTTLSSLSSLPLSRPRSASTTTTLSGGSPHLSRMVDNPNYNLEAALNQRGMSALQRPDSLYTPNHVYEEIKEKDLKVMEKIEEATTPETPTYTNLTEDSQGYMIPKSPSQEDLLNIRPRVASSSIVKQPLPDLPQAPVGSAPPYSRVGECGLVPATPAGPLTGPGYSRVGSGEGVEPCDAVVDPLDGYDSPRPLPHQGYDVPRSTPVTPTAPTPDCTDPTPDTPVQANIPVPTEVCMSSLTGTIV